MLSGKFSIPFLAACLLLSGCDSTPTERQASGSSLDIQLPEKIRTSLAVDFTRVSGVATVNDRIFEMERLDDSFRAIVPDIPVNSELSIDLRFSETLTDGRILDLAQTAPEIFSVGSTDTTIEITEDEFSYAFDDDNDGISNIVERNDGTDPFIPENVGNRTITVEFNLPQRIEDPQITQALVLISDLSRAFEREDNFIQASGIVPNSNTIDVDIRLSQLIELPNPDPTQEIELLRVIVAQALLQLDPGNDDQIVMLTDSDFNFDFDEDQDGTINLEEIQSGTNPVLAE